MLKRVLPLRAKLPASAQCLFFTLRILKVLRLPRAALTTCGCILQRTHREASVHMAAIQQMKTGCGCHRDTCEHIATLWYMWMGSETCREGVCVHTVTLQCMQMGSGTHRHCSSWCLNPFYKWGSTLALHVCLHIHTNSSLGGSHILCQVNATMVTASLH